MNRLVRIPSQAVIGGVSAGLAAYFRTDPLLIRLLFVVFFFVTHGTAGAVYLILWIALPTASQPDALTGTEAYPNRPALLRNPANARLWGAVLIGAGVLFLLDEFVWWFNWNKLWPLLLVGIGVYLIFKDRLPQNVTDNQPPQNPL